MAVDCLKFNQVVAQQQLHTLHGIIYKVSQTWYAVNDLGKVFFSILIRTEDQKQFAFMWDEQRYSFPIFPPGYVNTPAFPVYSAGM